MSKVTSTIKAALQSASKATSAKTAEAVKVDTAKELEFYVHFDQLLANDLKAHKHLMGASGSEWEAFKQVVLACEPFLVSKESLKVLTTKITAEYASINSIEAGRIRNTCLSNARRVAFGGAKSKDAPVVNGFGFNAVIEAVNSIKSGGIASFRVAISAAVPAALKDGRKDAEKPTGGSQSQVSKRASSEAKKAGDVVIITREDALTALQVVLHDAVKFFNPGTDSNVILEIAKLQAMLDQLIVDSLSSDTDDPLEVESLDDIAPLRKLA